MLKVAACRECNVLLGSKMLIQLEERGVYLYRTLVSRYERVLHSKYRNIEELEEYGPNMRSILERNSDLKGWIERRLTFMENVFRV